MQLINAPQKFPLPFANSGAKTLIPVASQIGIVPGGASLTDGFPPLTRTPIAGGGVPPSGLEFNGIFFELTAIARWLNAGAGFPYDGTFANDSNVNGYPKGARVLRSDGLGYWLNTADNNTTDPETVTAGVAAAAGWVPDLTRGLAAISMASANVTLTPAQYGKPIIVISGTLTANLNLIFPDIAGEWTVINNAIGAFTITAKTASGSGVVLGTTGIIVGDATNIYSSVSVSAPVSPPSAGAITGLLPTSITGTNTTAAVTVSSGQAADSTSAKTLIGPGHSWAVSNGNAANGYQGGSTLPNSGTIHFFECWGGSGYCSFASTSLMPTLPAGYNINYRRIFSLNTTAAGALVAGSVSEIYGGALQFSHATPLLDVSATPTAANRTLYALTVPAGIKVQALGRVNGYLLGTSNSALVTSTDEPDSTVGAFSSVTTATYDVAVDGSSRYYFQPINRPLLTNTSGQIGIRSLVASGTVYWLTSGFIDFRRS